MQARAAGQVHPTSPQTELGPANRNAVAVGSPATGAAPAATGATTTNAFIEKEARINAHKSTVFEKVQTVPSLESLENTNDHDGTSDKTSARVTMIRLSVEPVFGAFPDAVHDISEPVLPQERFDVPLAALPSNEMAHMRNMIMTLIPTVATINSPKAVRSMPLVPMNPHPILAVPMHYVHLTNDNHDGNGHYAEHHHNQHEEDTASIEPSHDHVIAEAEVVEPPRTGNRREEEYPTHATFEAQMVSDDYFATHGRAGHPPARKPQAPPANECHQCSYIRN